MSPVSQIIRHGPRDLPRVALSFDDGPDTIFTPPILDVLEQKQAPATFYVIGMRAVALPDVTRRMKEVGGDVGSHAWSTAHIDLRTLTPRELLDSLVRTHEAITELTGQIPLTFRPPYGHYNAQVLATASRFGYPTVLWDVDSEDWRGLTAEQVLANVMPFVQNGSIILMHNATAGAGEDLTGTINALPLMIDQLRARGFELVTVPELLGLELAPPTLV